MSNTLARIQFSSQVQLHDRIFHEHGAVPVDPVNMAFQYAPLIVGSADRREWNLVLPLSDYFALQHSTICPMPWAIKRVLQTMT